MDGWMDGRLGICKDWKMGGRQRRDGLLLMRLAIESTTSTAMNKKKGREGYATSEGKWVI